MLLNGLLSKCLRLFRTYFRWLGHTHPWKVAQPLSWNGSPLCFGPFEVLVHPEEVSCYKLNAFSSCTCATHVTFVTWARFANSFSKHFTQIPRALAFHVYTCHVTAMSFCSVFPLNGVALFLKVFAVSMSGLTDPNALQNTEIYLQGCWTRSH